MSEPWANIFFPASVRRPGAEAETIEDLATDGIVFFVISGEALYHHGWSM